MATFLGADEFFMGYPNQLPICNAEQIASFHIIAFYRTSKFPHKFFTKDSASGASPLDPTIGRKTGEFGSLDPLPSPDHMSPVAIFIRIIGYG